MELLLALAGLAGLAVLLQSKSLPSVEDYEQAKRRLAVVPTDPAANTVAGKYLMFVQGDYKAGAAHLVLSDDKTLAALAEHDSNPTYADSGEKKVGLGDEWVAAGKKYPPLSNIFYDRAAQWYIAAWPDLNGVWKDKTRVQGQKMAVARPKGGKKNALPSGWLAGVGKSSRTPQLDGEVARSGSYSVRMMPADPTVKGSYSVLKTELFPLSGKALDFSAYTLSDGTENVGDLLYITFYGNDGKPKGTHRAFYPIDLPFWNRVSVKAAIPDTATRAQVVVERHSKNGTVWVDDFSVKVDGKEVLPNPSFEDK